MLTVTTILYDSLSQFIVLNIHYNSECDVMVRKICSIRLTNRKNPSD